MFGGQGPGRKFLTKAFPWNVSFPRTISERCMLNNGTCSHRRAGHTQQTCSAEVYMYATGDIHQPPDRSDRARVLSNYVEFGLVDAV